MGCSNNFSYKYKILSLGDGKTQNITENITFIIVTIEPIIQISGWLPNCSTSSLADSVLVPNRGEFCTHQLHQRSYLILGAPMTCVPTNRRSTNLILRCRRCAPVKVMLVPGYIPILKIRGMKYCRLNCSYLIDCIEECDAGVVYFHDDLLLMFSCGFHCRFE